MKWKDKSEEPTEETPEQVEGDYYDEEEYSPWHKGGEGGVGRAVTSAMGAPLVWIGGVVVVVVLLVILLMPGKEAQTVSARDVDQLRMRIEQLEEQYNQLAPLMEKIAGEGQQKRINDLSLRLNRFEKQVERSFDQIDRQLTRLQPGSKSVQTTRTATPPTETGRSVERQAPSTGKRVHTVAKGDTLYGISKRYEVPVGKLRERNGLGPDDTIKPGQQLVIGE